MNTKIALELLKLTLLKDNWDGRGSPALKTEAINKAVMFFSDYPTGNLPFCVSGDEEGNVVVELWDTETNNKLTYDVTPDSIELLVLRSYVTGNPVFKWYKIEEIHDEEEGSHGTQV